MSIESLKSKKIEYIVSLNSEGNDNTIKRKPNENGVAYTPLPVEYFRPSIQEQLKIRTGSIDGIIMELSSGVATVTEEPGTMITGCRYTRRRIGVRPRC